MRKVESTQEQQVKEKVRWVKEQIMSVRQNFFFIVCVRCTFCCLKMGMDEAFVVVQEQPVALRNIFKKTFQSMSNRIP